MARLLLLAALASLPAFASDGKWTPQQLTQLGPARLKALGLSLPPSRLWDEKKGTGLLAGAIAVGNCSGAFISEQGLFVTNHHCLFSVLQQHATPERNLIQDGFLADRPEDELRGKTLKVRIPKAFKDVTAQVRAAIPPGADDLARYAAIEAKQKALIAECERQPGMRCQVASFDGGSLYTLVQALELSDVRLVYAPPRGIGEFGGEVDNWVWPRHNGDFAIGRAYGADNLPYRSEQFFPVSTAGVKPNDFVMVLGYPGKTYRSYIAEEMADRRDRVVTDQQALYAERIADFQESTRADTAGSIAVAADVKTLANRVKNAQGQLAGFARGRIVERQRAEEEAVVRWATARGGFEDALAAREGLTALVREQQETWQRDLLLGTINQGSVQPGSKALLHAATVVRAVLQRRKPDLERDPEFMERNQPRLREKVASEQKSYFAAADQRLFLSFVRRALALPPGQRLAGIDRLFKGVPEAQQAARVSALYAKSQLLNLDARLAMFDGTEEALRARKDPLVELGLELDADLEGLRERLDRHAGAVSRLRPVWRKAVLAHAGAPVAPDANGTLRVTFGRVKGYEPRDGVFFKPQTTLSGLLAKHTGVAPFDAPEKVRTAAQARQGQRWVDPALNDVPLCFLSDADTTGGNSGSPTVNARGELVGVNFDRVWENVANDFGFNPDVGRNMNADVRYLLWMLELQGAHRLMTELKVPPKPEATR